MSKVLAMGVSFILVGISFLIMSLGCIKNKYIVYLGGLLFIAALIIFFIGCSDVIFMDNRKLGG